MSILEKIIASVAPGVAYRRAVDRARLDLLAGSVRSYDAAKVGHRTDGWTTVSGSSANSEISPQLPRIRERSRDLVRNNPYAAKAVNVHVNNLVGSGVIPKPSGGTPKQNKAVRKVWDAWTAKADADGMLDFYGLQALVARTVVESGECLIRRRTRRMSDGLAVPLQLQVLEPDFIDTSRQGSTTGGYTIDGIEFDALGRRTAYWLYSRHPGDNRAMMVEGITSSRVPAEDILHVYDKLRPGQDRGVPWFAPVILRSWDLATYDEAELMRKRVEACIAAFVEQEAGGDVRPLGRVATGTNTDGTSGSTRRETFEPGMIEYMRPGESVSFNNPTGTGGYGEYMQVQLRGIAAGAGVMYEQMTGDLSLVNYSSIQFGNIEFRASTERHRWQMIVCQFSAPVWGWFMSAGYASGALIRPDFEAAWVAPPWQSIDREKDTAADKAQIRSGLLLWADAATRNGYDPDEALEEIAAFQKKADALGIVLDIDVRQRAGNGNAVITGDTADAGTQTDTGNG